MIELSVPADAGDRPRAADLRRGDRISAGFLPPLLEAAAVEDVIGYTPPGSSEQWACILHTSVVSGIPDATHVLADALVPVDRAPVAVPADVQGVHLTGRQVTP